MYELRVRIRITIIRITKMDPMTVEICNRKNKEIKNHKFIVLAQKIFQLFYNEMQLIVCLKDLMLIYCILVVD